MSRTNGLVVLSHGLESGPQAAKVAALAEVAEALGWRSVRPDFRDLDATRDVARIVHRVERLLEHAAGEANVVYAGSSLGAFASGLASLERAPRALFLMAPPLRIDGHRPFDAAPVPTTIVHGWDDELIPAAEVIAFAHARRARLHLVDDTHRLAAHVEFCAQRFGDLLRTLA
jgi:pimeloyl-ACP methyl ester carboxylesterase